MTPNRILTNMQPFMNVLLMIFVIVFLYGWLSNEDYDDNDFTVTITYDCKRVLTDRDYPAEVLSECLELRDELARKN